MFTQVCTNPKVCFCNSGKQDSVNKCASDGVIVIACGRLCCRTIVYKTYTKPSEYYTRCFISTSTTWRCRFSTSHCPIFSSSPFRPLVRPWPPTSAVVGYRLRRVEGAWRTHVVAPSLRSAFSASTWCMPRASSLPLQVTSNFWI